MTDIPDDVMKASRSVAISLLYPEVDDDGRGYLTQEHIDLIARAILAERERCAKIASLSQERVHSVEAVGDPEAWLLHDPAPPRPQKIDPRWMSIDQISEQIAILEEELRARGSTDRAKVRITVDM